MSSSDRRLQSAQLQQRRQPHRRQAGRLDIAHVPARALDAEHVDLLAQEIARRRSSPRCCRRHAAPAADRCPAAAWYRPAAPGRGRRLARIAGDAASASAIGPEALHGARQAHIVPDYSAASRAPLGKSDEQALARRGADAALGDQPGDQPRRRHVEGVVGGGEPSGTRRTVSIRPAGGRPAMSVTSAGIALLDRDVAHAVLDATSRWSATAARHRTARRCHGRRAPSDRCRSCCRRRRRAVVRSVPTMTRSTRPCCIRWPPVLSAITVCGTPCWPSSQAVSDGALVARPRLVDPDMDGDAARHARRRSARARCPNRRWRASRRCNGSAH